MNMLRLLVLACLVLTGSAAVAADPVGKLVSLVGTVDVLRDPEGVRQPLLPNNSIFLNDRVVTGVGSQAKLMLNDDSILKVGQSSELLIDKQLVGPGGESQTQVKLLKGRLRSVIGRKLGPLSSYEVHTEVAVTGVRGTDFEVWVRSLVETAVRAYQGQVEVKNIVAGIVGSVMVTPNTFTMVNQGAAPLAPAPIPPGKSLSEQLDGAADEQDLDQGEEQQLEEQDLSESSEAGKFISSEIGHGNGAGSGVPAVGTPNIGAIVDDTIGGETASGQIGTVTQPVVSPGVELPINIEIPAP